MRSPGHVISHAICEFFRKTGVQVYRHPAPFFWIPVLLTAFSAFGLLRWHEENRIWYLYSPTGAASHYEHAVANEFFDDRGGKFWLELAITAHDMGNLLRREYLDSIDELSQYLQFNFTVTCPATIESSGNCSFDSLCSGSCNDNQVVPIFNLIYRNSSRRLHPNFRLTFPTMHLYNDEYYVGEHFAGVKLDPKTNLISDIKVIMLYYRTDRQNPAVDETLKRWENEMNTYTQNFKHPLLNISSTSDGIVSKEVRRNGFSCVPYFNISIVIVVLFIFATNWREHFTISHNAVMAILGIAGPLMAIGTTFGLLLLIGLPFNSITLVMPFLIIGVGCDDVFIIIHAHRKANKNSSLEDQMAHTMEEAGPSITVTSATNVLSFAIGILTPTPAISLFCLYTCVAVFIDFIYQLTFFVAAMVYEEKRQAAQKVRQSQKQQKYEVAAIQSASEEQSVAERTVEMKKHHNGIVSKYCRVLNWWQTRLALLLVLFCYWYVSYKGCASMEIKMDTANLVPKDSRLIGIKYIYEQFVWREGQLILVFVNAPPDVTTEDGQRDMFSLVDRFERLPFAMGRNSTSFWLRSFLSQSTLYVNSNQTFYNLLNSWMQDPENGGSRWNDMVRLRRQGQDVVGVQKFMFATGYSLGELAGWGARSQIQAVWRNVVKEYAAYNVTIFQPYSFYVDQLDSIAGNTASTVIVAALTMDLACLMMIPSMSSILSSTVAMISINIGVFGLLSMWGVNLDPISMCTTLMSIGFSVDFTAHISYHYYRNPISWTTDERLADALRNIGWPMLQAGFSTILSVSPLLIVDSYMILVFWKTIFLVTALGLAHGIIFLPALLLTVGRAQQQPSKKISEAGASDKTISDHKAPIEFAQITQVEEQPKKIDETPRSTRNSG
ncbi:unnamed protein product, partial [Mesorhabditis spiculigera]